MNLPAKFAAHFSVAKTANAMAFSSISSTYEIQRYGFDPARAAIVEGSSVVFGGSLPLMVFSVSPDGKQLAFPSRGKQEDVFIINTDGTDLRQLTDDPQKDRAPSWSPDGKRIYFYSERGDHYETWSIRPDGSGLTQVTRTPRGVESSWFPRASPDGSRLLTFNNAGSYIWRIGGSRFEPLPRIDAQHVLTGASWSPDGRLLIGLISRVSNVAEVDGVEVYSFAANHFEKISNDGPDVSFGEPVWLPDGKRILYPLKEHLILVDTMTKERREITPSISGLSNIAIPRDGQALYVRMVHTVGDIWLMKEEQ
jgi:Tol biopolymer transport system component